MSFVRVETRRNVKSNTQPYLRKDGVFIIPFSFLKKEKINQQVNMDILLNREENLLALEFSERNGKKVAVYDNGTVAVNIKKQITDLKISRLPIFQEYKDGFFILSYEEEV